MRKNQTVVLIQGIISSRDDIPNFLAALEENLVDIVPKTTIAGGYSYDLGWQQQDLEVGVVSDVPANIWQSLLDDLQGDS